VAVRAPRLRGDSVSKGHGLTSGVQSEEWTAIRRRLCSLDDAELERVEPVVASLMASSVSLNRSLVEAIARTIQALQSPLQEAFLARSLNALADVTTRLHPDSLGEAVGERADISVLVRALQSDAALEALRETDRFMAKARLRDIELREAIIHAEGGTLTVDEVSRLLGVSRQAVDKRRRAGKLIALPFGHHRYEYPGWQFGASDVLNGIADVLAELPFDDPWSQAAFFLGENSCLDGERPLDVLRRGDVDVVRRAAWAMGEQGAA
jgi:DNA-directed RNA polymerase specialized sigma24 family protein